MHHSIRTPFFSCDFVRKPRHSSTIPAFSSASHGKNSRFAGACLTSLAPLVLYKLSFLSPSFPHSTHSTHSTPVQRPYHSCVPSRDSDSLVQSFSSLRPLCYSVTLCDVPASFFRLTGLGYTQTAGSCTRSQRQYSEKARTSRSPALQAGP